MNLNGKILQKAGIALGVLGVVGSLVWLFQPRQSTTGGKSGGDASLVDPSLRLTDVDLEQADEKGNLLWKIKAKQAVYNREKKEGTIEGLKGELYQEGKLAFKIEAEKGEIKGDGKVIVLKEKIVAVNVKDEVEIKGQEMEWQTQANLLKVKNKFTATHKTVKVTGKEGQYFSKKRLAEFVGTIVAEVKTPKLKMTTEKLNWNLEKEQVETTAKVFIERKQEDDLIDRARAEKGSYDLKAKVAKLQQAVQVNLAKPELEVTGDDLVWNTEKQLITADKPIKAYSKAEAMTVSADRGELKIKEQTAYLTQNVRGTSEKNRSTIGTDRLVWFLEKQTFEATGNVVYRQASPAANLVGKSAIGNLATQEVKVTGGPGADDRVVIDIVPNLQ